MVNVPGPDMAGDAPMVLLRGGIAGPVIHGVVLGGGEKATLAATAAGSGKVI